MPQSPISKSTTPCSVASSFRINKMTNKCSVNLPSNSFRITLENTSHISSNSIALSLPRIFVEFSLKPVYPTMVGKVFNFIVFRLLEDAFITQKIASRILYSCPPGSYHYSPGRGKLFIPKQNFF